MSLKNMYSTILEEQFPSTLKIILGETTLTYTKRTWSINGETKGLRYGENPDQPAALYALSSGEVCLDGITWNAHEGIVSTITDPQILQAGKHLGKTNFTDIDNGCNILQYTTSRPAAVILKHNNPCGAGWSKKTIADALEKAFWADRIAAFGGTIVVNRPLDVKAAELIAANYFEVIAAPDYPEETLSILTARKNLRILKIPGLSQLQKLQNAPFLDIKSLCDGGLILQQSFMNKIITPNDFIPATATTKENIPVTAKHPTPNELEDLLFGWAVAAGVTSNSIVFVRNGATVAIGTGEQDRVGAVELAIFKAYTKYADQLAYTRCNMGLYELRQSALDDPELNKKLTEITEETNKNHGGLKGSVAISDGFFPFRDGIDLCIDQGITAIAQPGGSLRDYEAIIAVNEAYPPVSMVFTGQRAFKH